jgi:hypothetical protein
VCEGTIKSETAFGQTVNYRYSDIERVELGGRDGHALFLSTSDGKKLEVYGATSQLKAAQEILQERAPQAFESAPVS